MSFKILAGCVGISPPRLIFGKIGSMLSLFLLPTEFFVSRKAAQFSFLGFCLMLWIYFWYCSSDLSSRSALCQFFSSQQNLGQQQRLQDHFPLACFYRKEDVFPLLYCSIFSLDVLLCTLQESGLSCVAVVTFPSKLLVKRETRILGLPSWISSE